MWSRKEYKRKGKTAFHHNFWKCITVCFIVTVLVGEMAIPFVVNFKEEETQFSYKISNFKSKNNSDIVNEFLQKDGEPVMKKTTAGVLAGFINNISKSGSFIFGVLNAINQMIFKDHIFAGIIIAIGVILSVLYFIFISSTLTVGKCRFFLENRKYSKTKTSRIMFTFHIKKTFNVSMGMLRKNIYLFLWDFTIIGGFIKYYSYSMVPYLLAENPTLSSKDAIFLSRQMMDGYKWKCFLLDISYIGYYLIGIFTFNVFNLLYTNPYRECTMAEVYFSLRSKWKEKTHVFWDSTLEGELVEGIYPTKKYPIAEPESVKWMHIDYRENYSLVNLILLFFCTCFIGWIWEVLLNLFQNGTFVNRGTLLGPWLPIYGSGATLILILLKKVRDKPVVTFLLTMFICGIVEYMTGWYLEIVHHMNWWDYTGYFLNIGGKVCLEGLLVFGLGGCAFLYLLAPFLNKKINLIKTSIKWVVAIILMILMVLDFRYSSKNPNTGEGISSKMASTISYENEKFL